MKKFLAVATALVLAISSLCVFVFADDEVQISFSDVSVTGRWSSSTTYPANSDGSLTVDYTSQYQEIWFVVPSTVTGTITSVTVNVTSGTASDLCLKIYDENNTAVVTKYNSNTYTLTEDQVTTLASASTVKIAIMYQGTAGETYTFSDVTVTTQETTSSGTEGNETVTIDGVTYDVVYDNELDSLTGWSTIITVTDEVYGYLSTSGALIQVDFADSVSWLWAQLVVQQTSGSWDQEYLNEWSESFGSSTLTINVASYGLTSSSYFLSGDSQIILNMGDNMVASNVKILVPSTGDDNNNNNNTSTTSTMSGLIYVNDEYHAIKLNGHFIVLAHTDDNGDGVCDLCHQAFSADEEESSDIVMEDVEVEQPAEDTDIETEEDGEDIDVGDTGSDAEETTDSNPTTGVVLVLVPMAIAGFAVVSSKRR
ncbi:MAG: hypothetical protein LUH23_05990 [Oscillospiraceae bacterium]|nr:hypothetical protein [Oscillospiraceae bacterium]